MQELDYFKAMLMEAPVAMALFWEEMRIRFANPLMLQAWDKDVAVIGKRFPEAVPELGAFDQKLKEVYTSGIPYAKLERKLIYLHQGELKTFYYNSDFQPIKDTTGKVFAVLGTAKDVTAEVTERRAREQAAEMLGLAVASAKLGTWYIDTKTREMVGSVRLKELFGYYPDEPMSYEQAMAQIAVEHRERVRAATEAVMKEGQSYDLEYPIIGYHDQKLRWVRATGQLYLEGGGEPAHFSGTVLDITERKLEEQRKDDFITIASHELKTPVTSLKANLEILDKIKDEFKPTGQLQHRLIEKCNRSVRKITNLINDLLNASRITSSPLELHYSTFTIAEMLDACCSDIRAGGHTVTITGDLNLQIHADEYRIDQVVTNLISNAARFAPASKEITVDIQNLGNWAKVSVKDNGQGITPDRIPYLFERYYRGESANQQYGGLGVGLYICKAIIDRHGGGIGAESEQGKGSTFWFTLPLLSS